MEKGASIVVDKDKALANLKDAFNSASGNIPLWSKGSDALKVLEGTNKTYKYILVTALLAKATDDRVNPLALQKQAQMKGAYDPRSLCSRVFSSFEEEYLGNALGGSKDPLVNKPARFPVLSPTNPTKDPDTLSCLFNCLAGISQNDAKRGLIFCIKNILKQKSKFKFSLALASELHSGKEEISKKEAYLFIDELLKNNFGGEALVIGTTACLRLMYKTNADIRVEVHPVNQSGKSSLQCGDIDVYQRKNHLFCSIEAKDKDHRIGDINHAASQCSPGCQCIFVVGRHGKKDWSEEELNKSRKQFLDKNIILSVVDIDTLVCICLANRPTVSLSEVLTSVKKISLEMNCRTETQKWIDDQIDRKARRTDSATT